MNINMSEKLAEKLFRDKILDEYNLSLSLIDLKKIIEVYSSILKNKPDLFYTSFIKFNLFFYENKTEGIDEFNNNDYASIIHLDNGQTLLIKE